MDAGQLPSSRGGKGDLEEAGEGTGISLPSPGAAAAKSREETAKGVGRVLGLDRSIDREAVADEAVRRGRPFVGILGREGVEGVEEGDGDTAITCSAGRLRAGFCIFIIRHRHRTIVHLLIVVIITTIIIITIVIAGIVALIGYFDVDHHLVAAVLLVLLDNLNLVAEDFVSLLHFARRDGLAADLGLLPRALGHDFAGWINHFYYRYVKKEFLQLYVFQFSPTLTKQ